MADNTDMKAQIRADLDKAKTEGQLRSERIRDILREAVSQAVGELKEGTGELRLIVKDAVSTVIDTVRDQGTDAKDEIQASIEGAVEGVSDARRTAIAQIEGQVDALQTKIDAEESQIEQDVSIILSDLEETAQQDTSDINDAVSQAVDALRNSPEASLLRKRYAQLRAQLELLQANINAEGGMDYDNIKRYLDKAKAWYDRAYQQGTQIEAKPVDDALLKQQTDFEQKMSDAGRAAAQRERQIKQRLRELFAIFSNLVGDNPRSK
ncbi:MAG: histidine kinase [Elainellaceae cyanobacterium]